MRLTSAARLRIVTISLVTILTATIGIFATFHNYDLARQEIDRSINSTVLDAAGSPNQELSAALFHIDEFSLNQTLALFSRDGNLTIVKESTAPLFNNIPLEVVSAATSKVRAFAGVEDFRFRALLISGGDYLVIAQSAQDAITNLHKDILIVVAITLAMSILAFLLLSLYIRRLKRRDDADALARMQEFLGDASHELRTPLTVIKGYVEMLSKGQMTEMSDQERAFNRVTSEISRMESLIKDLLLLAELGESAKRDQEEIDLSVLLRGYAEDFATLHPERDVEIQITDEIYLQGIREYLVRFIQNALSNISRHTEINTPVRISLSASAKTVKMVIEDGGPGLPEAAYKERVRSLNRFDKSRSRENGGSGLGMSIMAAVVEKLSGELTLRKSEIGGLAVVAEFSTSNRQ